MAVAGHALAGGHEIVVRRRGLGRVVAITADGVEVALEPRMPLRTDDDALRDRLAGGEAVVVRLPIQRAASELRPVVSELEAERLLRSLGAAAEQAARAAVASGARRRARVVWLLAREIAHIRRIHHDPAASSFDDDYAARIERRVFPELARATGRTMAAIEAVVDARLGPLPAPAPCAAHGCSDGFCAPQRRRQR